MKLINLVGNRYGKLTVLSMSDERKRKRVMWECKCDCGNTTIVSGSDLTHGNTISCGCMSSRHYAGERTKTHGLSNTRIYAIWRGMINRCENKNQKSYKDYGAKGVRVCVEWHKFENFYSDMGSTYKPGLTIERKDFNGDYCPDNCMWATKQEQALNKSNLRIVTYRGYTSNLADVCRRFNVSFDMVRDRLHKGWTIERALSQPKRKSPTKNMKEPK